MLGHTPASMSLEEGIYVRNKDEPFEDHRRPVMSSLSGNNKDFRFNEHHSQRQWVLDRNEQLAYTESCRHNDELFSITIGNKRYADIRLRHA